LIKLNLGSGPQKLDGYTNVDIQERHNPDIIWDLRNIPYPWNDNTIDSILLSHVIEHISYRKHTEVFKELYRILKPGGFLTIVCPDIIVLYERYVRVKGPEEHLNFVHFVFGGHEDEHDYHNAGYTEKLMEFTLIKAGFNVISTEPGMKAIAVKKL